MIQVSDKAAAAIASNSRTFLSRFLYNGTAISGDIRSVNICKGSCGEAAFTPGAVFSSYIDAVIDNCTEALQDKELTYQVGVVLGDGSTEWYNVGRFTVHKPQTSIYTTSFTARGRISAKLGTMYESALAFPATIGAVLKEIEDKTGVTIDASAFDTTQLIETEPTGYLCRDVLVLIAGLFFGYATEDADGNIVFAKFINGNVVQTDGDRTSVLPTFADFDTTITGVKVTAQNITDGEQVENVPSFATENAGIQLSNPLMTQDIFNANSGNIVGFSYRPATVSITLGDFRLEPFDTLQVTDYAGVVRTVPCMSVVHRFDGGISTDVTAPAAENSQQETATFKGSLSQAVQQCKQGLTVAQLMAGKAQDAADNAQQSADDAAKVATNFMSFDTTNGLLIGNKTNGSWNGFRAQIKAGQFNVLNASGTQLASFGSTATIGLATGSNVYIDSDSVDIRKGTTALASFTSDKIELGKNSRTSTIDLCNGLAQIYNSATETYTDILSDMVIDAGHTISLNADYGVYANAACTFNGDEYKATFEVVTNKVSLFGFGSVGNMYGSTIKLEASRTSADSSTSTAKMAIDFGSVNLFSSDGTNSTTLIVSPTLSLVRGALAVTGTTTLSERLYLANGRGIWSANADGTDNIQLIGLNASNNVLIGNSGYTNANADTYLDGNAVYLRANNGINMQAATYINSRIVLKNAVALFGKTTEDTELSMAYISSNNNMVFGYGSYNQSIGTTYLYGNDVHLVARNSIHTSGKLLLGSKAVIGNNISYAAMHTDGTTEMSLALLGTANNSLYGYGSYTAAIGAAYYDGNTVYMRSNNGISLTGTSLKYNGTDISLDGHTHRNLYYTDGIGGVTWVISGGAYYLRPADNTNTYYFGSQNFRWDTIYSKNALNTSSDMRLKKDFSTDYDKYIAMLDRIEPTTFVRTNTDDGKRHTGYIAQKVLKAMKDAGLAENDFAGLERQMQAEGSVYTYGLAYEEFIPILHAKIKQLENRIAQLEQAV